MEAERTDWCRLLLGEERAERMYFHAYVILWI